MSQRRAVILNGSAARGDRADQTAGAVAQMFGGRDWEVIEYRMADLSIAPCLGCFGCWIRTPGICVIADDAREIARTMVQSDVAVYVTPIVFGGYSAYLKSALDRMIPIILPHFTKVRGEVHHVKRYRRYPNVLGIGLLDHPDLDQEEIFTNLVHRSSLNMRAPMTVVRVLDRPAEDVSPTLEAAVVEVTR